MTTKKNTSRMGERLGNYEVAIGVFGGCFAIWKLSVAVAA